mgnify:CR=1 FL=1
MIKKIRYLFARLVVGQDDQMATRILFSVMESKNIDIINITKKDIEFLEDLGRVNKTSIHAARAACNYQGDNQTNTTKRRVVRKRKIKVEKN